MIGASGLSVRIGGSYFTQVCSGSEAGSYLRLIDVVYHSTLGLSVIKKLLDTSVQRFRGGTWNALCGRTHIIGASLTEMCCGTEAGSCLRLIDSCITQLKAQGPSRTCNESKEEEEEGATRTWNALCGRTHIIGASLMKCTRESCARRGHTHTLTHSHTHTLTHSHTHTHSHSHTHTHTLVLRGTSAPFRGRMSVRCSCGVLQVMRWRCRGQGGAALWYWNARCQLERGSGVKAAESFA